METKSAIIGKIWDNSTVAGITPTSYTLTEDMVLSAGDEPRFIHKVLSFSPDRNLNTSAVEGQVSPLELKAGTKLLFYVNNKRDDKRDADYSVSVQLPVEIADRVIKNSQKASRAWSNAHPSTPIEPAPALPLPY